MGNLIRPNIAEQTGVLLILVLALTQPTPSFAGVLGNSDQAILDAGGTISRVAPNWRIVCLGEGMDAFGVVSKHKHCRIEKNDFKAIAVITSEGLSIPYLPSRPACGSYSGRMRVDGRRIGKLPLKEKIAASVRDVSTDGSIGERLEATGQILNIGGPKEFSGSIAEQSANVAAVVKAIDFKPKN